MSASLPTRQIEKPWGRNVLPAPFRASSGQRIGEIWFDPPAVLPQLLVKYIFTSEKTSVQVHPSDAQTLASGLGRQGKGECWLVIDAKPGAALGIGFRKSTGPDDLRQAALDGSIEALMNWRPVEPGDFFYIPAGTVHAIGPDISLIEVQQNSDITYRLYDYGRPRELHLDKGIAVACGEPYVDGRHKVVPEHGSLSLVAGPLFRLDQIEATPPGNVVERYTGPLLVIPRDAPVRIGERELAPGECGLAPALSSVVFPAEGVSLIAQPCAS